MLYTGVTGKISIDGNEILHMANWSVDLSKNILDDVSFGQPFKGKAPGINDWSSSFDGTTDFSTGSGQYDLVTAFANGTFVDADFYLDDDTFLSGNALIESLSISSAADGKSDISIGLAGNLGVLFTLPPSAADASLSALTIGTLRLTPAFSSGTTSYTAATTNTQDAISAITKESGATVAISVGGDAVTNGSDIVWDAGTNTVSVVVTNGSVTKTYTVIVTKS